MVFHACAETYLSDQHDGDEEKAEPRASSAEDGLERNLVKGVAVVEPSLAESDVGVADGAPGKEGSKTRELEEPVEDGLTGSDQVHVAKSTHDEDGGHGKEGTARSVNVGEDLGSVALLAESSEGTGPSIDTGNTNRDDRDQDDTVHEVIKAFQAGVLAGDNEGRRLGVTRAGAEKPRVVGSDKQTDKEEAEDVEAIHERQWLLRVTSCPCCTGGATLTV